MTRLRTVEGNKTLKLWALRNFFFDFLCLFVCECQLHCLTVLPCVSRRGENTCIYRNLTNLTIYFISVQFRPLELLLSGPDIATTQLIRELWELGSPLDDPIFLM